MQARRASHVGGVYDEIVECDHPLEVECLRKQSRKHSNGSDARLKRAIERQAPPPDSGHFFHLRRSTLASW